MVDYYGNRHGEVFTFKRVSWAQFATRDAEVATYTQFTGGSVEYGAFSALKVTGSFEYVGDMPDTTDLLRVYYSFADDAGEVSEPVPLGTFVLGFGGVKYTPAAAGQLLQKGTVSGYSTLKVLQDRLCGLPLTFPAGTDPVAKAVEIVQSMGLRVNAPASTSYSLASPHTFEADDSYLTVVNWLLTNCSTQYQAAFVDGYGVVQIQEYSEPGQRSPVATFRDDAHSIMLPEVEEETGWQSADNVVRLYYESDTEALWAVAKNKSGSRASLANRGNREQTFYEEVDEIADLAALEALASSRLKDRSAEIEHVSLTHAWLPLQPNDAVAVVYANMTWTGTVQSMRLKLAPSAQTKTQLRRTISAALEIETDGGTLWTL